MTEKHENLRIQHLSDEQMGRTSGGYRFTVTSFGATAHTAFRTAAAAAQWLADRGLGMKLPAEGDSAAILGHYWTTRHYNDPRLFSLLEGTEIRVLDNAEFTLGKVQRASDGAAHVHYLNVNCARESFDYRESQTLADIGVSAAR